MPDKERVFTDHLSRFGCQNISQAAVFFCRNHLNEISDDERIAVLKKVIDAAVAAKNEAVAREALEAIQVAYSWKEQNAANETDRLYGKALERALTKFQSYIQDIFWKLPDAEEKRNPIFADLKLRILEFVSFAWEAEPTEDSKNAFRFLCSAFPVLKFREKEVLELVRNRTGFGFDIKHIPFWLGFKDAPGKLKEILVLARARNGGVALALEDIRNSSLLAGFHALSGERSEAACEDMRVTGACIATMDAWGNSLIERMKKPWTAIDKEIGQSEYVRANLWVKGINLEKRAIVIGVKLYKGDSKELCQDVIGRARRHAFKFAKEHGRNIVLWIESDEFPELNQEISSLSVLSV